jgi:hypothetical protein
MYGHGHNLCLQCYDFNIENKCDKFPDLVPNDSHDGSCLLEYNAAQSVESCDISEVHFASIFKVEKYVKQGTRMKQIAMNLKCYEDSYCFYSMKMYIHTPLMGITLRRRLHYHLGVFTLRGNGPSVLAG